MTSKIIGLVNSGPSQDGPHRYRQEQSSVQRDNASVAHAQSAWSEYARVNDRTDDRTKHTEQQESQRHYAGTTRPRFPRPQPNIQTPQARHILDQPDSRISCYIRNLEQENSLLKKQKGKLQERVIGLVDHKENAHRHNRTLNENLQTARQAEYDLKKHNRRLEAAYQEQVDIINLMKSRTNSIEADLQASKMETQVFKSNMAQIMQKISSRTDFGDYATDMQMDGHVRELFSTMSRWAKHVVKTTDLDTLAKEAGAYPLLLSSMPLAASPKQYHGGNRHYSMYALACILGLVLLQLHEDRSIFTTGEDQGVPAVRFLHETRPANVEHTMWQSWMSMTKDIVISQDPAFTRRCEDGFVASALQRLNEFAAHLPCLQAYLESKLLRTFLGKVFNLLWLIHFHPAQYELRDVVGAGPEAVYNSSCHDEEGPEPPDGPGVVLVAGVMLPALLNCVNEAGEELPAPLCVSKAKVLTIKGLEEEEL